MTEIIQFLNKTLFENAGYPTWILLCAVCVVIGATQIFKFPLKKLTNTIANKTTRDKVNTIFMLLPFGVSYLGFWILSLFTDYAMAHLSILSVATTSQIVYEFCKRLFNRLKKGETITTETIRIDFANAKKGAKTAEDKFNEMLAEAKTKKGK